MTKRIFTGIIVVALIIMLACAGLIMGVMYDYLGKQIDKELKNEASLVAAGLEEADGAAQGYLERLSSSTGLKSRITLMDGSGNVIFDSVADETSMENHADREEFQEALLSGEGHAVRDSSTMASYTRYYAVKLSDGNILRISTDHYSQLGLILDTFGMVVVIVAILIALAAFFSHRITRRIIRPINEIDLNHPDIEENYEELAPLLHRIHQQNSKLRRQMERLRRSQEEFNIITSNMKEGLLIINKDLEVLTYNRSAVEILGLDSGGSVTVGAGTEDSAGIAGAAGSIGAAGAAGVIGEDGTGRTKPVSVFMLNRSEPFRKAVEDVQKGIHCRHRMEMAGSTFEVLGSPVSKDGEVTGAVLIIMNVTAQEEGERLRREFTSNVSHELKTPLTSIYGVSDMMLSGLVKPEDMNQFAQTIKEESARLISLIDDIIQLSRLDENDIRTSREDVDLYLVARDVISRLTSRAREQDVTLRLEGESAVVNGVDYILDEIVYNLCENGVKYNKVHGTVTVSVTRDEKNCVLKVTDTGVGIPKEDICRVFERFYRVDKSHCGTISGTGLGLSIVKHGVAFHGGVISIDSIEGVGTTVTVRFDAAKAGAEA